MFTYTGTLNIVECPNCHMDFGVTPDFERARRRDHGSFYCPSGHRMSYRGLSDEEKLRKELEREKRRAASAEGNAKRLEYQRRAALGQVTKIKNRVGRGVCPCCNRTFQNLARHMESKHPEYAPADADTASS